MSVNWDERFIELARHVASWSKDPSTKVGAVIVDDQRRVVALGYNGFPRGIADDERLNQRHMKYARIVHAEVNAVLNAPLSVRGCTLYLTIPPCGDCSKVIIQSGIARVCYPEPSGEIIQRWGESLDLANSMLFEAGVEVAAL